ncbi:MAG: AI-2E family transporter [Coriobacteriales bacterium]|jgi:predicted PurR-regulated permease PerM|nr:AI-2E family transporter [Coriobacteriales bacterium]
MPQDRPQDPTTDTQERSERVRHLAFLIWATIGIVLLAVAVGYALLQVSTALVIVGLAAFIVFVLRVPVAWLERKGVARWLGSLVAYLGGLLVVALVMLIFIPIIWNQAIDLIQLIPGYITSATAALDGFYQQYSYLLEDINIQQLLGNVATDLSRWAGNVASQAGQGVITLGMGMVTSVVVFTIALIAGYWILKDLPALGREMRVLAGPRHEETVRFASAVLSRAFGGYLRGVTVAGLCTGTIAGIGYYLIGLPYPAVLGLFTGLMNFIPYVGPWIAGATATLIGLFVSPLTALLAIVITVLAQQFTDNFITPRVMSSVVELHPAVVLVGVFAGGALGGILGLIVAIPLLSSLKAFFVYYFERRTGRRLVGEAGALFKGRGAQGSEEEEDTAQAVEDERETCEE